MNHKNKDRSYFTRYAVPYYCGADNRTKDKLAKFFTSRITIGEFIDMAINAEKEHEEKYAKN